MFYSCCLFRAENSRWSIQTKEFSSIWRFQWVYYHIYPNSNYPVCMFCVQLPGWRAIRASGSNMISPSNHMFCIYGKHMIMWHSGDRARISPSHSGCTKMRTRSTLQTRAHWIAGMNGLTVSILTWPDTVVSTRWVGCMGCTCTWMQVVCYAKGVLHC